MVFQEGVKLSTTGHGHMQRLDDVVQAVIASSRVQNGVVHLFNVGSTGALGTIEDEPGLQQDLPAALDRLVPPSHTYAHEDTWHDGNAHSHLQATLLGPSLTVPVKSGRLVLGTWQQIVHVECDTQARERTIVITVLGE